MLLTRLRVVLVVAVLLNAWNRLFPIAASVASKVELNRIRRVQIRGATLTAMQIPRGTKIATPVYSVTPQNVMGQ